MNEKFHNSIKKTGEDISLSAAERARMRNTVRAYMEMKPARVQRAGGPLRAPAPLPASGWFFTFRFFNLRPVAAVLVLALFISSAGVSYAAQSALPGDVLYPVKTHLNEPLKGAFAASAEAKTAWAMDVAGERVREAATLAAEGRLNASTQQELQANFEQYAKKAAAGIAKNASSSPEASSEDAVRFEARLSEYENVLAQIGAAKNVDVAALTSSVQAERNAIVAVRAQAESRITSRDTKHSAAQGLGVAARAQLDVSTKLAQVVSESLSSSSAELVSAELGNASDTISAGEDFTSKHAIPDALGAFQSALMTTEKLGVFLQTSSDIHARTGLIVGEPQKENAPRKTPRRNKNDTEGGSLPVPAVAAAMNVAATSSAVATPTSVATTSTGERDGNNTDNSNRNGNGRGDGGDPHSVPVPNLPISVPLHISL